MTERYQAWLEFQVTLETVRWYIIGAAALVSAGYLMTLKLPEHVKRYALPTFEAFTMLLIYGLMLWGQLYVK
jgi:uncharacterized membrane protein